VDQAAQHERGAVRTLCLVLAHTGCRISEALALTVERVDLAAGTLTFQTLKQHGKVRYRSIPVPDATMDALELVHAIRKSRRSPRRRTDLLWPWGAPRPSSM
jgi:integrase